jgi:hypothetical protein
MTTNCSFAAQNARVPNRKSHSFRGISINRWNRGWLAGWFIPVQLLLLVLLLPQLSAAQTPQIASVKFSGSPGNYTLTINGNGFGSSTVHLPFTGDVSNFRIGDAAQVSNGEWGYTGDSNFLTYNSWSDKIIQVSGFGGQPGDAVTIALWNASSQIAVTWGGNVPTKAPKPVINAVELSGDGQNLEIFVDGQGFGPAPSSLPPPGTPGDVNNFSIIDFRSHCGASSSLFGAGNEGWGMGSPDPVTLYYESWSDSQIVISGFGGSYGTGCATYQAGDPLAIIVYNSNDSSFTGAQTAWGGSTATRLSISATVQDLTTGKPIKRGQTVAAGDQFQVTLTTNDVDCAGQFVVTALGGSQAPPSVLVQVVPFIVGPASGGNSATGGTLTANGFGNLPNDWKVSATCNGAVPNQFSSATFEFFAH